jgi:acyl-CoA synthetase (AMP-forming)/AMP-acid ligase II
MILTPHEQIEEYTRLGAWGTDTVDDLLLKNANATPDAVALVDPPNRAELGLGDPARLTYRDIQQSVDRLAGALIRAGIKKDDIVMVQLPNIVELILAYLAAARIGAILSPLPVQFRTHELKYTMGLTEPVAFITALNFDKFNYVDMVLGLLAEFPSLKTIIAVGENLPSGVLSLRRILSESHDKQRLNAYVKANTINANDIFTICWTSGTESDPKGVPRSHNLWLAIAYTTVDGAQLEAGSSLLNPFPMVNMSGIGGMLFPWLLTGGKLVMHHPLNLPVFLAQIKTEGVNYTVAPPVLLNLLLRKPSLLEQADLSTIKSIGSGSAPLTAWMTTQWKEKYNIDILNFFGSNEGIAMVSAPQEIPDPAERARLFPRYGDAGFTWSNRSTRGYSTRLVDPQNGETIVEAGKPGEIVIKGSTVFNGYFRRRDLTEKSFDKDGYFHTGDLFSIEQGEDGKLSRYRAVGRLKDVIIRGGTNISPEELEVLIAEHPKVADVSVVGFVDGRILGEEQICAVVVPKPDQELTLSEIHDYLKAKDVALYKMPKKLWIVPALPRNPVGKVLKRDLRAQLNHEHEA